MSTLEKAKSRLKTEKERHLPGEEGTWIFILGDMTVFAFIFAVYIYYRADDPALFDEAQQKLQTNFGAINTLLLLSSSLMVVTAVRAVRNGVQSKLAPNLFLGAFVVGGCGFVFMKVLEWGDKFQNDITPSTNDFFMYYYVMTGLHLFHLLLGMGILVFLYFLAKKPRLTEKQMGYLEGGACFWHMVDLLWIVLFPLLYLVH